MMRRTNKITANGQPDLFTEQPPRRKETVPPRRVRTKRSKECRSVGRPVWMTAREFIFLKRKAQKAGYSFSRFLVVAGMRYRVRSAARIPTLEDIVEQLESESE